MSAVVSQHIDSNEESEPDEDPKLMLLVEAGLVPGLDDNLQHLQYRNKKKKKGKKKNKRRKQSEGESREPKKAKREDSEEERYILNAIISNLNKPTKYDVFDKCLMISEWLLKVPDDFDNNWIVVPSPPGKRMLVIAASGSTRSFAKSGDFLFYFQSALPGGHLVEKDESSKSLTILDCIWYHKKKTYYILDVLSWNNSHLLHCETNFRFYWLEQKMSELNSSFHESEKNHYRFSFLPRAQCKRDDFAHILAEFYHHEEFMGNIDGFLFYNQSAPYFSGTSSTVGWLKPFMVPEVFNIPASSELLVHRPDDYSGLEQYIVAFEKNKKQIIKKERKIRRLLSVVDATEDSMREVKCNNENEFEMGNEDVTVNVVVEGSVVNEEEIVEDEEMEPKEMTDCDSSLHTNNRHSPERS